MMYGLKDIDIKKIQLVFSNFEAIDKVVLYGSRAKGNFRNNSDIDLTLMGNGLKLSTLLNVESELDDLLLPYTIDLSVYDAIENPDLLEHINRIGSIFYDRIEYTAISAK